MEKKNKTSLEGKLDQLKLGEQIEPKFCLGLKRVKWIGKGSKMYFSVHKRNT